ncbi:MAG: DUF4164 family protein [Candidatus Tokpelaia sp.]|nr:MAG: DUF4164 family protein [Candidatus Tokpelaia sp.]KAA6207014.1 MAG: DUF4164 family protein [Candidatus Tokpelaia sp.]
MSAKTLEQAFERLEKALNVMESAVNARLENAALIGEVEEEVQRMNADRSRLAQELDNSETRSERLELANKEVSRRLIATMETLRTILEN